MLQLTRTTSGPRRRHARPRAQRQSAANGSYGKVAVHARIVRAYACTRQYPTAQAKTPSHDVRFMALPHAAFRCGSTPSLTGNAAPTGSRIGSVGGHRFREYPASWMNGRTLQPWDAAIERSVARGNVKDTLPGIALQGRSLSARNIPWPTARTAGHCRIAWSPSTFAASTGGVSLPAASFRSPATGFAHTLGQLD